MSYRVYNSGNMLAVINTDTWRVEKLPKDKCWYEYVNTEAPILYSLYYDVPERDLILDKAYTDFQRQDGTSFASDAELLSYLDLTLGGNDSSSSGIISTGNSSTTLLTSGSTFTGSWEDVSTYASVVIAVKTDQDGSYTIQFSPDGTNVDSTLTRYYRTSEIAVPHRFTTTRQYCRITFTNDSASDQTYLRLQTTYGDRSDLNAPIDSVISKDFDAIVTRPTFFKYEVALGRRQGTTLWNKFGYNNDIDTGAPELLAAQDGNLTILLSASTLSIVSDSASDDGDPAGVGANSIIIYGIDGNRIAQTETIELNGVTPVVTTSTWLGINRVEPALSGSSQTNVGNITITAVTGGSVQAYIPAGAGTTQQLMFFTQAKHKGLVDWVVLNANKISAGGSPVVTFKGWVYNALTNTKKEVFREIIDTSTDSHTALTPSQPFIVLEQSVIYIEVETTVNNTVAAGRISLIEYKDVNA